MGKRSSGQKCRKGVVKLEEQILGAWRGGEIYLSSVGGRREGSTAFRIKVN